METAYPERAEILQVTLEYAAEDYQAFFQPVYRILFTQDYWDAYLAEWMGDEADAPASPGWPRPTCRRGRAGLPHVRQRHGVHRTPS